MRAHDDERERQRSGERERREKLERAMARPSVRPSVSPLRLFSTPFATHVEVFRCDDATPLDIN